MMCTSFWDAEGRKSADEAFVFLASTRHACPPRTAVSFSFL